MAETASLGSAIAENFKQGQLDPNAFLKGEQIGEQAAARKAARDLLAQKRKEDMDAKAQKSLFDAVNVSGIDRWDEKTKNEVIAKGTKDFWDNRATTPMAAQQSLLQMHNQLSNLAALKENREKFRNNPNKTEYGKTLEADIEKSGSLKPHLGKTNIFGDEGVTSGGMLLSPDNQNVDYDKIINQEVDRGKEQAGQINKRGGFLYEEKGYPRTSAEAAKYEQSIKSATGFDTKLNSLENIAATTWQDPKIRRSFSRANEDLYQKTFESTPGTEQEKRAAADLQMANKWAEYVDKKYIGRISAQNIAKPAIPKEEKVKFSEAIATTADDKDVVNKIKEGLFNSIAIGSHPNYTKPSLHMLEVDEDGKVIGERVISMKDAATNNFKNIVLPQGGYKKEFIGKTPDEIIKKRLVPEAMTGGEMVNNIIDKQVQTKPLGTTQVVTFPKNTTIQFANKTFQGQDLEFKNIDGETYIKLPANTFSPGDLEKMTAETKARLKEGNLININDSQIRSQIINRIGKDKFDEITKGNKRVSAPTSAPVTQTSKKEIKESDIASKAAASGYSEAEYRKLLKQKGVTIKS